ncbi:MAG: GIY-YIG nuclease family protein [Chitinophagaceae bacterium]
MFQVYILYSPGSGKSYVGYTNSIERRMEEHNFTSRKGFTLRYRPWVLVHTETFNSRSEAMTRENFYKSGQGREIVKKIVQEGIEKMRHPPKAEMD